MSGEWHEEVDFTGGHTHTWWWKRENDHYLCVSTGSPTEYFKWFDHHFRGSETHVGLAQKLLEAEATGVGNAWGEQMMEWHAPGLNPRKLYGKDTDGGKK